MVIGRSTPKATVRSGAAAYPRVRPTGNWNPNHVELKVYSLTPGSMCTSTLNLTATRHDKLSVLVHIDPGVKLYTFSSTWFGFQFPVGLTLGYAAAPDLTVAFGVDLPMTIFVTPSPAAFYIAPLFGPAFEYHIDRQLAIGLNTRFGPVINTATPGVPGFPGFFSSPSSTNFGFVTQLLLSYRL